MLGPEGWLIDSWTPTFVDKNKECQLGSYGIWNDKKSLKKLQELYSTQLG